MKDALALRELIDFAKHRLPEEHLDKFWTLAIRALKASTDSTLEYTAKIVHGGNRYQRLKDEHEQVSNLLMQIGETCRAHDFDIVLPHFVTLLRIREEFNAPLPSQDEIRAGMEREADERMMRRNLREPSALVETSS